MDSLCVVFGRYLKLSHEGYLGFGGVLTLVVASTEVRRVHYPASFDEYYLSRTEDSAIKICFVRGTRRLMITPSRSSHA